MKVIVLGAGIIGISTAWYLLDEGHDVTVVDRQADAALETSFANGAQILLQRLGPGVKASVVDALIAPQKQQKSVTA